MWVSAALRAQAMGQGADVPEFCEEHPAPTQLPLAGRTGNDWDGPAPPIGASG